MIKRKVLPTWHGYATDAEYFAALQEWIGADAPIRLNSPGETSFYLRGDTVDVMPDPETVDTRALGAALDGTAGADSFIAYKFANGLSVDGGAGDDLFFFSFDQSRGVELRGGEGADYFRVDYLNTSEVTIDVGRDESADAIDLNAMQGARGMITVRNWDAARDTFDIRGHGAIETRDTDRGTVVSYDGRDVAVFEGSHDPLLI